MPTYYTTTSSTAYPYTGNYWSTSTTTDCSGYTSWITSKKLEKEAIRYWLNSLKELQITEDDILALIEGDD